MTSDNRYKHKSEIECCTKSSKFKTQPEGAHKYNVIKAQVGSSEHEKASVVEDGGTVEQGRNRTNGFENLAENYEG